MAKRKQEDNTFEMYFEWWLNDLQKVGLVRKFKKHPESKVVLNPVILYSNIYHPKKDMITTSHNLLQGSSYTWDYDVEFHVSLLDVFIGQIKKVQESIYVLEELYPRTKGDSFYDFSYYYLNNGSHLHDDYVTVSFDVKPPANAIKTSGAFASSRDFPYNQKLVLEQYNILVNKVVPCKIRDSLFNKTFLPERYLLTDAAVRARKLGDGEKVRSLKEWMASLNLKPVENAL